MTDKFPKDDKPDDAAFERTLRNLVSTPPTPHEPLKGPRKPTLKPKEK